MLPHRFCKAFKKTYEIKHSKSTGIKKVVKVSKKPRTTRRKVLPVVEKKEFYETLIYRKVKKGTLCLLPSGNAFPPYPVDTSVEITTIGRAVMRGTLAKGGSILAFKFSKYCSTMTHIFDKPEISDSQDQDDPALQRQRDIENGFTKTRVETYHVDVRRVFVPTRPSIVAFLRSRQRAKILRHLKLSGVFAEQAAKQSYEIFQIFESRVNEYHFRSIHEQAIGGVPAFAA